jgi:hypothetical protein
MMQLLRTHYQRRTSSARTAQVCLAMMQVLPLCFPHHVHAILYDAGASLVLPPCMCSACSPPPPHHAPLPPSPSPLTIIPPFPSPLADPPVLAV